MEFRSKLLLSRQAADAAAAEGRSWVGELNELESALKVDFDGDGDIGEIDASEVLADAHRSGTD